MSQISAIRVAIVDYGLGNLFSVQQACAHVGMDAEVTAVRDQIAQAHALILPGVGAFGDAMRSLGQLDLVGPIRDRAHAGVPVVGICLGLQLLMTESHEFGVHLGLGLIEGPVVLLEPCSQRPAGESGGAARRLKVPHVGWNSIRRTPPSPGGHGEDSAGADPWAHTPLEGLPDGVSMYFVHSFYARPAQSDVCLSWTRYGDVDFCSSLLHNNIFGCQFHPERSGPQGLTVYRNLVGFIRDRARPQDV